MEKTDREKEAVAVDDGTTIATTIMYYFYTLDNIAAKAGKMNEAVFHTQANFFTPEARGQEASSEHEQVARRQ